ncbi:mitochondrial proton/calcium exchanger protein-like protein isoform X1 [Tanacetum coccineum]
MGESTKIHEENSNLIREIRASTDAAIRNQRASIKTLEIQIGPMSKVLQERGFESLPSSTKTNLRDHVKSILTTVEVDASSIRRIGSHQYVVSTRQNSTLMYKTRQTTILFLSRLNDCYCKEKKGSYGPQFSKAYSYGASHIDKSIPRKKKDPGRASVSVMPLSTYLNLGLGELAHTKLTVELADRTVLYLKGIAENVLVGIGKFIFPVDFIILDMPEDVKVPLILGRPFLSTAHAKIDVFKRKITLRLKRDQVDDLMPTIEEGEVVKEFRARNDVIMVSENFGYPSDCDHDKKIRIDCAHNLKFYCMIDMDAYYDEGMGDVIFSKPFLREVGINARRFEGMITIYNGNKEVTYQMVRSHPRFKRPTNKQCNKISPLLKVSEEDKMNGILHSY